MCKTHRFLIHSSTKYCLLFVLTLLASNASAELIFRNSFETGLLGSMDFIVVWQDDQGTPGKDTQILARGMDNLFSTKQANDVSQGTQIKPLIGVAKNGSFVVVWQDDADGNGTFQIHARGFNADGSERFARLTVNIENAGQQLNPDMAMAPNGDFVVVWEDDLDGNGFYNIRGRGFYANGSERFSDRGMNSEGAGQQYEPSVDIADNGSFVVAWTDDQNNNAIWEVAARGFNANGTEKIAQFKAHNNGDGNQWQPAVAMAPDGSFVIAWADDADYNFFYQVKARGFNANGSQKFPDITLNQRGTASQYQPDVGMAADGRFAAAWVDQGSSIVSRVFNNNGTPLSDDIVTNTNGLDLQISPSVSVNNDGDFVVIWDYLGADGYYSILGRRLDAAGSTGDQFTIVNAAATDQLAPSVGLR